MKNIKVWKDEEGITREEVIAEGTYTECVKAGERYVAKHPLNPRLVIVIANKGIRLIRLVSSNDQEEEQSLELYKKIKGFLNLIDKNLKQ